MRKALFLFSLILLKNLAAASADPPKPVYIYLYARIDDPINTDLTAERLKRTLAVVQKLRQDHPNVGASVVVQLSGAMAQVMADQNAHNGLADLVRKSLRNRTIELGYHGGNEPGDPIWPPLPDVHTMTGAERWNTRAGLIAKFLVEYRDPVTGRTDPKRPGGLKEVEAVFGPAIALSDISMEVGGDPEAIHQLRRTHPKMLLFGVPDPEFSHDIPGYKDGARLFGQLMSPKPDIAPEVFWQDDVLRTSDFSGGSVHALSATSGVKGMKRLLAGLDRTHPHVLHVELSPERLYLDEGSDKGFYPTRKYAAAHPDHPALPKEAILSQPDIENYYKQQDELLNFLTADFFQANPGSRFVSSEALLAMTPPAAGFDVKFDELAEAATSLNKGWGGNTHPPDFATGGGRIFSLADMFQMMVTAFAARNRTGKFPDAVRLNPVFGPVDLTSNFGNNEGTVSADGVGRTCARLEPFLNTKEWTPEPQNAIPTFLTVDESTMNASQFLHIMAQALNSNETRLDVHVGVMNTDVGLECPRSRMRRDFGTMWTLKPAPLTAAK